MNTKEKRTKKFLIVNPLNDGIDRCGNLVGMGFVKLKKVVYRPAITRHISIKFPIWIPIGMQLANTIISKLIFIDMKTNLYYGMMR